MDGGQRVRFSFGDRSSDDGAQATLRVLIPSRDHITDERTTALNAPLLVVDLGVDAARSPPTTSVLSPLGEAAPKNSRSVSLRRSHLTSQADPRRRLRSGSRHQADDSSAHLRALQRTCSTSLVSVPHSSHHLRRLVTPRTRPFRGCVRQPRRRQPYLEALACALVSVALAEAKAEREKEAGQL